MFYPPAVELLRNLFSVCFGFFLPSRMYQAVKLYLFSSSSGGFNCPLAMTDGAAKVIEVGAQWSLGAQPRPGSAAEGLARGELIRPWARPFPALRLSSTARCLSPLLTKPFSYKASFYVHLLWTIRTLKPVPLQVVRKVTCMFLLEDRLFSCSLCRVAVKCIGPDLYLM